MTKYTNSNQTALGGVYVSPTGEPSGPWNKIAGLRRARVEGLGAEERGVLSPRHPGLVQPVPRRRSRRSRSRVRRPRGSVRDRRTAARTGRRSAPTGISISAAGRRTLRSTRCPSTTHSDQHSMAIERARVYVGNDGGLFRRPLRGHGERQRQRDRLGESERECSDAAGTTRWRSAGCRAAWQFPADCRTTAVRCCCPKTCWRAA